MVIVGCLAGCRKDKVTPEYVTLSVQFEDGNGTKSYMTPYYMHPRWEEGDTIYINSKPYRIKKVNDRYIVDSVESAGTYNAYFFADENFKTDDNTVDGSCIFTLNDKQDYQVIQNYSVDTTIKFGAPMVATSTNMSLTFKNTCAVLAIQITNKKANAIKIDTIKVIATGKEGKPIYLYGTLTASYDNGTSSIESEESGSNAVKLNCQNTEIRADTNKTFFIYVPPTTDTATFKIKVIDYYKTELFSKDSKEMRLEKGKYVKVPITIEDQTKK